MTSSAATLERLQDNKEPQRKAREIVRDLEKESTGTGELRVALHVDGTSARELGPELSQIMQQVIFLLSEGEKVVVSSRTQELTTTVAARELGMSRPTLMKHIKEGDIPAHKVGSHFRLRSEDVDAFRRRQLQERFEAFERLREDEMALGLGH